MNLHNTLTKKVENFKPLKAGKATVYSCGPTVYDHIHIGNLRAYVFADTLRRSLAASGLDVIQVMNFTDVDDKTIVRSAQTYPDDAPEEALSKLTRQYEDIFLKDVEAIGNDVKAVTFVRATESLKAMQDLIKELFDAKVAYIADDGVYFSIKAYRAKGKKYGQLLKLDASNTSGARIDNDEYDKESVHDFALWKTRKNNEPAWEFELDGHQLLGRPGWHIECSAMSSTNLGQPFDIHTGGVDNIFPHHENEIAQSTALHDQYAQFFVHNEHLLVDGRKMAKSLNNFFTLRDIQEKGFLPLAFRVLVLQAHYRNPLNFSWDSLTAAQNRLEGLYAMAVLQHQAHDSNQEGPIYDAQSEQLLDLAEDDLSTPQMLAEVSKVAKVLETSGVSQRDLPAFKKYLQVIDDLLGFDLSQQPDLTNEQQDILSSRQAAREAKDWAKTDELRDKLLQEKIVLKDTPHGQLWFRQL